MDNVEQYRWKSPVTVLVGRCSYSKMANKCTGFLPLMPCYSGVYAGWYFWSCMLIEGYCKDSAGIGGGWGGNSVEGKKKRDVQKDMYEG